MYIQDLDKNPYMKDKMKILGFNKKKYMYCRPYKDALQYVGLPWDTWRVSGVRYYYLTVGLEYPRSTEISKELNISPCVWGLHAGHLGPDIDSGIFKDWLVKNTASQIEKEKVIDDIINYLVRYCLPYMNNLSTHEQVLDGMLVQNITAIAEKHTQIPLFLYLHGRNEEAIEYMDAKLPTLLYENIIKHSERFQSLLEKAGESRTRELANNDYEAYQEFVIKMKRYMKEHPINPNIP